jgi:hypothetical protein
VAQVFHRLASSTQTSAVAKMQIGSCELWGGPPNSPIPCAKAYRNALPTAKQGIEFTTLARPCPGNGTPYEARWYYPKNPSVRRNSLGYAVIDISVHLNRQVP